MFSDALKVGTFQLAYEGTFDAPLDESNRLVIPKKMRQHLRGECAIYLNELKSISIYSTENWHDRMRPIASCDRHSLAYADLTRMIYANSSSGVQLESSGRVALPAEMCRVAGLSGRVKILGCFDRCEVWSPEGWEEYQKLGFEYQAERRAFFNRLWSEAQGQPTTQVSA